MNRKTSAGPAEASRKKLTLLAMGKAGLPETSKENLRQSRIVPYMLRAGQGTVCPVGRMPEAGFAGPV